MTEEKQLLEQAQEGNKAAFGRLVDLHKNKVLNIAYKLLDNYEAAQDVAQESFIKAYVKLGSFKKEASFMTWLYRITYNTACNHIRKNKLKTVFLNENVIASREDTAEKAELRDIINDAVERLPLKLKTVVVLRDYEELSYREISDVIKRPVGTVESRLSRARARLKEILKDYIKG
ncbi:sigma-70 family RNA polymerase sigma factor [bacterium]|jgi:RNA polymerase sigma-70 factor (ECF subfamily)|nr:sigma-70 family RNA polymerase sigma factor [bacterium]